MLPRSLYLCTFLALFSAKAMAAEVSLLSGLYRSQETKDSDVDTGRKRTISAGGRFAEHMDPRMFWFAQGILTMKSYSKGELADGPSDSTGLNLGGGVRYYFTKLAEAISPYGLAFGTFKTEKDATTHAGGYTETEKNGLYYGASFGIRFSLAKEFFVDLETRLFESALFATEKSEDTTFAGGTTTHRKSEKKESDLYVESTGLLNDVVVALGMRL